MFTTVDLFSGAGGLSYGFVKTGKFRIVAAAENNPDAQKTYQRNHKDVLVYSDVHDINYADIIHEFGKIDVVIGGPPCQGFSCANRQHSTIINTKNNLVKEYVRAIQELKPRAFVMENVAMLRSPVHRFLIDETESKNEAFMSSGIVKEDYIELLPSSANIDDALSITSMKNIDDLLWNDNLYKVLSRLTRYDKNQPKFEAYIKAHKDTIIVELNNRQKQVIKNNIIVSTEKDMISQIHEIINHEIFNFDNIISTIKTPIYIQTMLRKMKELQNNHIHVFEYKTRNDAIVACVKSYSVLDYITETLGKNPYAYKFTKMLMNAALYGAPQKRERFILVGIASSEKKQFVCPTIKYVELTFRTVRDAIEDIEDIPASTNILATPIPLLHKNGLSELAQQLRGDVLYNHVCTATTKLAQSRFEVLREGENLHNLNTSLLSSYSNISRTQNTVYLRPIYDEPSRTVVNIRKSMWVHPTLNRAMTIREAARLQTFPDSYVFEGSKDSQYQQVGDAVPPIMATAIAEQIIKVLE